MNASMFRGLVAAIGLLFVALFGAVVIPAFLARPDIVAGFADGFVNPFAAGYSMDTIACWCLLAIWVVFEARTAGVRHGWVALVLGIVPGVAAGLSVYLLLRLRRAAAGSAA